MANDTSAPLMADVMITLIERMQYANNETEQERYKLKQVSLELEDVRKEWSRAMSESITKNNSIIERDREIQSLKMAQRGDERTIEDLKKWADDLTKAGADIKMDLEAKLSHAYSAWTADEKKYKTEIRLLKKQLKARK